MKKITKMDIAALVIWLLPVFYLIMTYSSLPGIVPLHYGADGKPNRYGDKNELITLEAFLLVTGLVVYLLLKFLPAIDPKKKVKYGEETFRKIGIGIILFMSAINIATLFATVHKELSVNKLILPIMGLLFAFLGNAMNSIKPNYFVGVRTPWTLENEDNWRATHRMAGKLWFFGGIVITFFTLLEPSLLSKHIFIGIVSVFAFVPVIYSYIYFKNHQADNNS